MKISLLGSNGFLSNAIARYAEIQKWRVETYGLQAPLVGRCDTFHPINLMEAELDCTQLLDCDMIVYATGAGIQSNLKEGVNLIYNLNVTVPVNICNRLKALDYRGVFVTFGSVFEIGETLETRFFSERDVLTSTCRAPSDYVVSKRMLTRFVSSYHHDFCHWHFVIPTIYGEGENPKRLIPYVLEALKAHKCPQLTSGEQTRQYVYVGEIPRLLASAFENRLASGVYNIEGPDTVTVKELVSRIFAHFDLKVPNECFGVAERCDVGMKYLALDGALLRGILGFRTSVRIEDVLEKYVNAI